MQMIRTTITMPKEIHKSLKKEAMEKDLSLNDVLVRKISDPLNSDGRESTKREKAFKSIMKLRKKINTKGINYRELIEHGRKY